MRVMRSKVVPLILAHVAECGADAVALANAQRIPEACREASTWTLDAPAVAVERVVALASAAAELLRDDFFGFTLADALPRGAFGAQEYAIRNAPTVGEAALRLVRYQRLTNDSIEWTTELDADTAALAQRVPGRAGLGRHLDEFLLATAFRFAREIAATPLSPIRVRLPGSVDPRRRSELAHRFGTRELVPQASDGALVFSREIWTVPVPQADAALSPIIEAYAAQLMPPEDPASGWQARVRDFLRRQLSGGAPTLEQCARAIGMTPRSLQRRLDEANTNYRAVTDQLRREEALRLVQHSDLGLEEISFLLGYSDRRAFVRAFQRWTGASPSSFRKRD